jgi:hypothetical protein
VRRLAAAQLQLVPHLAGCRAGWEQASASLVHYLVQQLPAMLGLALLALLAQGCHLACILAPWACWVLEGPQVLLMASWQQRWGILQLLAMVLSTLECSLQRVWVPCCQAACWLKEA